MSSKQSLSHSVQYPDERLKTTLTRPKLRRWVQAALQMPAVITLRFVDAEEGRTLNREYREKDYATNVLTFPYDDMDEFDLTDAVPSRPEPEADRDDIPEQMAQADIVLCTDVLEKEAKEQGKSLEAHAAHLVVHGTLHAQGYDHLNDEEAEEMETLEKQILAKLGIANPYED